MCIPWRVGLGGAVVSDVLAGYALGAFWLVLGIAIAERMRQSARFQPLS